jgi:hypothetical protein
MYKQQKNDRKKLDANYEAANLKEIVDSIS